VVRKHQFGQNQAHYEKSYFDKQHDHIIMTGYEKFDPRIQSIKQTIEEIFDIDITNHSLYLYGVKKKNIKEI
jgi:Fur family ferric uptake transcriptional regulator